MSTWEWIGLAAAGQLLLLVAYRVRWRQRHILPALEPGWLGLPTVATAVLLGVALSQIVSAPVGVVRVFRVGAARVERSAQQLVGLAARIAPLHDWRPARGVDGRWLEPWQSLFDYFASRPNVPDEHQHALYLQPVGDLTSGQGRVVAATGDFLARYFCLTTKLAVALPLSHLPSRARRLHPAWGTPQLLTTYLMHERFRTRLPPDAVGFLGITAIDLWPGEVGWHSVNGQASPVNRVGVLSMYRNGDADADAPARQRHLLRTLKVAAHEAAHILSLPHCPNRGCNMSRHNDRAEADQRRLVLCPECLAKLLWATGCDAVERYRSLASFFAGQALEDEAELHRTMLHATIAPERVLLFAAPPPGAESGAAEDDDVVVGPE